jgi:hypothetical protein
MGLSIICDTVLSPIMNTLITIRSESMVDEYTRPYINLATQFHSSLPSFSISLAPGAWVSSVRLAGCLGVYLMTKYLNNNFSTFSLICRDTNIHS